MSFGHLIAPLIRVLPSDTLKDAIVGAVSARADKDAILPPLLASLINVRPPDMFGKEVVDTSPAAGANQRLSYSIYPYAQIAGGGCTVVIAADENNVPHVLLGKNPGTNGWVPPGGFMKPRSARNTQGVFTHDTQARDRWEGGYMREGRLTSAAPLETLSREPTDYDKTMRHTARRELQEETGLDLRLQQLDYVGGRVFDRTTKTHDGLAPHQQQVDLYLADLRAAKTLPPVRATDDLEGALWAPLADIQNNQYRGIPIMTEDGFNAFELAVRKMRQNEYARFGVTEEAVTHEMSQRFPEVKKPESALGAEAIAWHDKALGLASQMQKSWTSRVQGERTTAAAATRVH